MENEPNKFGNLERFPLSLIYQFNQKKLEMTISDKAINSIKGNNRLIGRLLIAFDRGQNTLENWMRDKDIRLTTPTAVQIIHEETGLSSEEILEGEAVSQELGHAR
jgi:hypothetical protein